MATFNSTNNSIYGGYTAACISNLVLPIIDAAIILVVSVLVCLRVTLLGT